MEISDPNNYLEGLQLEELNIIKSDDQEVYYTILQEDDENYNVETLDEEYLDSSDNVFYFSLTNEEETLEIPEENEANMEESGINMALLEEVTLPDGTQAYVTRDLETEEEHLEENSNEENLDLNDDSPMLLQSISESLECEINGKSDEEADDIQTVLYRSEDSNEIFDESKYEQVLLEDGAVAMIERGLYKSILGQNNKNKKKANASIKMYECPNDDCKKSFTTMHYLRIHMRKHSGSKPYKCNVTDCDKAFATGYSLKAHSRTHTGEKPYGCTTCEKCFKTSGDLQKHIRIHTGEKPFLCPVEGCGRSFTTSNIRKVHIRSHTGERPYQCPEPGCGKAFASATNYKNHVRIHSGEKPYVCAVESCAKRFTEYSSLYKHQMVHDNSKHFNCTYCDRVFRQQSSLTTHKRTAHDIIATDNGTEIMIKMIDNKDGTVTSNIYTKILVVPE